MMCQAGAGSGRDQPSASSAGNNSPDGRLTRSKVAPNDVDNSSSNHEPSAPTTLSTTTTTSKTTCTEQTSNSVIDPDHNQATSSSQSDVKETVEFSIKCEPTDTEQSNSISNKSEPPIDGGEPVIEQPNELEYFKPHGPEDDCNLNPDFAVICSFIAQFGALIDLELDMETLKTSIEDPDNLDDRLIDLHVKLLKKINRYFIRDQWEKALIRFSSEYSYADAYEIECLGYQKTRPSIKLELLRRLLDAQFEKDPKFKASVNLCEANDLRILPLGRDIKGNTYWQRLDSSGNLRLFQEQPMNYESWKSICSNPDELKQLIVDLEAIQGDKTKGEPITEPYDPLPQIFPELFTTKPEPEAKVIETPANKKSSKAKKGRGRSRGKKSNGLDIVKEEVGEEEDGEAHQEIKPIIISLLAKEPTSPIKSNILHGVYTASSRCTIESQVKSTLEYLIDKVVSSFECLVRPLSLSPPKIPQDTSSPPKKQSQKKSRPKKEKFKEEVLPRRSSSRIQQLQLKKIAEEEEKVKKSIDTGAYFDDEETRSRSTGPRNSRQRSRSPEETGKRRKKERKSWKRSKGKKKLSWDKDDSDLSTTSSITASEEEEDFEDFEETFTFESNNYDDEFACEEEDTNIEPVIIKRARTARQSLGLDEQGELNNSTIIEEDKPCGRCDKSDNPEWILLCDMCDDGYHTSCCLPPLMVVPDGDWFCPSCEHKTLLTKLKELAQSVDEILDAKEKERLKRQRLRQVKKEQAKIEPREPMPNKRSRDVLNELNDPIALQALDNELEDGFESDNSYERKPRRSRARNKSRRSKAPKRRSCYKDDDEDDEGFRVSPKKPRKTYSRRDMSDSEESEEEYVESTSNSPDEILPKQRRARASVSYRFKEYDDLIKSAISGDTYEPGEEEAGKEGDEAGEREPAIGNYGRGKDMATIEALAYQQENGIIGPAPLPVPPVENHEGIEPETKAKRSRKKGRRLNDLDADSETENATSDESFQASSATELEDDDEGDILTESDGEETSIDELVSCRYSKKSKKNSKIRKKRERYESDDSDYEPRTRRSAAKKVSYKESTDEEDEDLDFVEKKAKKIKRTTLTSGEDSDASWKSKAESAVEDDRSTSCDEPESKTLTPTPPTPPKVLPCETEQPKREKSNTPPLPTPADEGHNLPKSQTPPSRPEPEAIPIPKPKSPIPPIAATVTTVTRPKVPKPQQVQVSQPTIRQQPLAPHPSMPPTQPILQSRPLPISRPIRQPPPAPAQEDVSKLLLQRQQYHLQPHPHQLYHLQPQSQPMYHLHPHPPPHHLYQLPPRPPHQMYPIPPCPQQQYQLQLQQQHLYQHQLQHQHQLHLRQQQPTPPPPLHLQPHPRPPLLIPTALQPPTRPQPPPPVPVSQSQPAKVTPDGSEARDSDYWPQPTNTLTEL